MLLLGQLSGSLHGYQESTPLICVLSSVWAITQLSPMLLLGQLSMSWHGFTRKDTPFTPPIFILSSPWAITQMRLMLLLGQLLRS